MDDTRWRALASPVVGSARGDNEQVLAVDPAWPRQGVDATLSKLVRVNTDGFKHRPFEAPAVHEPIIPYGVDAAALAAGLLGNPGHESSVHRPELFAQVVETSIE